VSLVDTLILGSALFVLLFASDGVVAWRSGSRGRLESGPYWYWAWATLLVLAVAHGIADGTDLVAFVPPVLSPVFSGFLVAGALRYSERTVPKLLMPAAVAIGLLRAAAEGSGWLQLSGAISLFVEPTGAAIAGWLVYRAASGRQASWSHRLMPAFFGLLAVVEVLGAGHLLFDSSRFILWPLWLATAIPLLTLQQMTSIERAGRAEHESHREREDREKATERLSLLASHVRDVITEIGADGRVEWISDSCREVLGMPAAALLGRHVRELAEELQIEDSSEGVATTSGDEDAESVSDVRSRIYSVLDGRGERRWFESHWSPTQQDDSGQRIVAVTRDVTERVKAEGAIRSSEARFRKFSLLGSDYCFIASGEFGGGVENWITGSLEEISGYSHEELQQIGFHGFLHPDEVEAARERVTGLLESGGESSHEFRLITKAGETRWIAEKIMVEREGRHYRVYGAARDITEQRNLEHALAQAQKLDSLGLLAGGIAHDFNNLLTVILGNVELAIDTAGESAELREDLDSVVQAVGQAQSLTQRLLAYAGRGAVERVPVDVSERVRSVSELISASSSGVDVELDLAEDLQSVLADPGEVQQLTMNLVLNAIEACGGVGRVQVTTGCIHADEVAPSSWVVGEPRPNLSYVVLEVADTGLGMSPETIERVFDPFFTTKRAGRGLGLAATIGIVRSIDGGIRVESRPQKGTTFAIYLPTSEEALPVAPQARVAEPSASGRILVVDDDERVQRVAARILRRRGFEVVTASSGPEALDAFRQGRFDVVLLDAVMPGMSGAATFDALREIRADQTVLMASGFDRDRAVGDLRERGLAGFIGKPFRADELIARISDLI
jgi:PAS domain S-box-containing protein